MDSAGGPPPTLSAPSPHPFLQPPQQHWQSITSQTPDDHSIAVGEHDGGGEKGGGYYYHHFYYYYYCYYYYYYCSSLV